MLYVGDLAHVARYGRNLGGCRRLLALDLVAHGRDRLGVGPDEDDAGFLESDRKRLALGEEAVAGVDRLGARRLASLDDLVDQQVGLRGGRRPQVHRLVRHLNVESIAIGVGIDRHRFDPHFPRGLDDAASNLTAVGDQDLCEHCRWLPCWRAPVGRRSLVASF